MVGFFVIDLGREWLLTAYTAAGERMPFLPHSEYV